MIRRIRASSSAKFGNTKAVQMQEQRNRLSTDPEVYNEHQNRPHDYEIKNQRPKDHQANSSNKHETRKGKLCYQHILKHVFTTATKDAN